MKKSDMFNPFPERRLPILMATQHPDNASVPFWSDSAHISALQETQEIFESFFTLGCDEYMWDWEGKFADEAMIERLMGRHADVFRKQILGRDKFVTLRIPNIWEENSYKLSRAYMSVLSGAEFTKGMGLHSPPVFEFILPMTKRADQLFYVQETFQKMAKMQTEIFGGQGFGEGYIHIIPLFERVEDFYSCGDVLREFVSAHKAYFGFLPPYLRPFIARSDPALNAGFVPAVLGCRLALREFYKVGAEYGLAVHPIIGTGSLPFRGGINPENIKESLPQYAGVKTVTLQSAFRYDYPLDQVKNAIEFIRDEFANPAPVEFSNDEFEALNEMMMSFVNLYRPCVEAFAPFINEMAKYIPERRERVQHVGMFGYSRNVGGVSLPRAIKFTAACYSMGIPPEFIGTGRALKACKEKGDLAFLEKHFFTLRHELKHAGKFLNRDVLDDLAVDHAFAQDIKKDIALCEEIFEINFGPEKDRHFLHKNLTSGIALKRKMGLSIESDILEAAILRKSLG